MTKYLPILFVFLLLFNNIVEASAQQRKGLRTIPDTVVIVYCSSLPQDINSGATYSAAQDQIKKLDAKKFVFEEPIRLLGDKFTLERLQQEIRNLQGRTERTRVLFHFFDHGINNGDVVPALSIPAWSAQIGSSVLNIQKEVIQPLIGSSLGFVVVLADACNSTFIGTQSVSERPVTEQGLSLVEMNKILSETRSDAKQRVKQTAIQREYRGEPLGLLRSSKGWIAISTAGPEQKAMYLPTVGGIGSLLFFDLLVNDDSNQKDWYTFLDEYRWRLESKKMGRNKKFQSPSWAGKINGRNISQDSIINPFILLTDDEVDIRLREFLSSEIPVDTLRNIADQVVSVFAEAMNGMENNDEKLPKEVQQVCLNPAKIPIYDDLNVAYDMSSNTGYIPIAQYRSVRPNNKKSLYIVDSMKIDRFYRNENRNDRLYIAYTAQKRLTGPGGLDTITRQRIFLEVQTEIRLKGLKKILNKVGRLMGIGKNERSEESPLLISHIFNIPGKVPPIPPPPPPDTPIIDPGPTPPPIVKIIPAEDYFQQNVDGFLKGFYALVERAANYKKNKDSQEQILQQAEEYFLNPKTDTLQVSILGKPMEIMSPADYFNRFWEKFDGMYDSVHYYFAQPVVPEPGNDGYVNQVTPDKWVATVKYTQRFEGFKYGKVQYADITTKTVTVWILRDPNPTDPGKPYYLQMGSLQVTSTKPVPKVRKGS